MGVRLKYRTVVLLVSPAHFGWLRGGFRHRVPLKLVDEFADTSEVPPFYKKKGKDNDETHGKHIGLHSSTPRPHRPTPGAETHTFETYTFRVLNVEIPAITHTYRNTDVCKKLLLHNVAVWWFFADILPTS